MQDGADIVLAGHAIDHGDGAALVSQKTAQAVHRIHFQFPGGLSYGLADEAPVLGQVQRRQHDVLPAHHLGDIVKIPSVFDGITEVFPLRFVPQALTDGVHAALEKVRRQQMKQLGGTGIVKIDIAGHVQPLGAGIFHQLQRLGDAAVPVAFAHGLQVADMHRAVQRTCNGNHLLHRAADAVALLTHMDGDGHGTVSQRFQSADQPLCCIEALRRVAQTEGDAESAVGKAPLQLPVDGPVV